jgi:uncharacterized protein HemX
MALAGAREQQGDLAGALAACREGLAIRRALLAAQPRNDGLRRDVSVSLVRAAGLLQASHDVAGALAAYRDADAVLRAMSPGDSEERQSDLAVLAERIAALEQGL